MSTCRPRLRGVAVAALVLAVSGCSTAAQEPVAEATPSDRSPIDGLTLHDVRRPPAGYQCADDGPYVFGTQVGPAAAELARGGDALSLTFKLDTGLVLEEEGDDTGRHSLLPMTRRGTYVLVPDGPEGWLVADWDVTFEHGQVRLVAG